MVLLTVRYSDQILSPPLLEPYTHIVFIDLLQHLGYTFIAPKRVSLPLPCPTITCHGDSKKSKIKHIWMKKVHILSNYVDYNLLSYFDFNH